VIKTQFLSKSGAHYYEGNSLRCPAAAAAFTQLQIATSSKVAFLRLTSQLLRELKISSILLVELAKLARLVMGYAKLNRFASTLIQF
jgi:hypothetical protein